MIEGKLLKNWLCVCVCAWWNYPEEEVEQEKHVLHTTDAATSHDWINRYWKKQENKKKHERLERFGTFFIWNHVKHNWSALVFWQSRCFHLLGAVITCLTSRFLKHFVFHCVTLAVNCFLSGDSSDNHNTTRRRWTHHFNTEENRGALVGFLWHNME